MKTLLLFLLLCSPLAHSKEPASLQSIYNSLDPTSVSQHFAFYELYPELPLGKQALKHAWELLQGGQGPGQLLPSVDIRSLISFVNRLPGSTAAPILQEAQLLVIEQLGKQLSNRSLKGYGIWNKQELDALPPSDIDLARGLFLAEMEQDTPEERLKVQSYEAHLDLIALQILARLPEHPTPYDKIRAINDFIFGEMRFRFPPHSLWVNDIDVYTLLPSVLDSRRGVCLGVSILYLCLAQRLDLSLEVITPPGHIYVRYSNPATGDILNIETTARGIDTPSEVYLGIETKSLQQRSIREVIGLAFFNQASVSWHRSDPKTTIQLYEKASPYLPGDYLLTMFLGFNYLFEGRTKEGEALLKQVQGVVPDHMIAADTVSEDYLAGKADAAAIQAIYASIDERRSSILEKQKHLEEILQKFPTFRQGILHLAITHLQLGREKEALPLLERYIALHPHDATANYYLAAIHLQRSHYNAAWNYLRRSESLTAAKNHYPRALKELRQSLQRACPAPL